MTLLLVGVRGASGVEPRARHPALVPADVTLSLLLSGLFIHLPLSSQSEHSEAPREENQFAAIVGCL